jgi:hypothetical protein
MKRRVQVNLFLVLTLGAAFHIPWIQPAEPSISIREFARMMTECSEPEGYFDSDNYISNERAYLKIFPDLNRLCAPSGVYLGVGPDQNYSYIALTRPRLVFIVDIRRQNALLHLYLKSLFQLSASRVQYLERLFGRNIEIPAPARVRYSVSDLLYCIDRASADKAFENEKASEAIRMVKSWNLGLSETDYAVIRTIAEAFFAGGPDLQFSSYGRAPRSYYPSYRQLLEETDAQGVPSNFLSTEESFLFVKILHQQNRIVPVTGDLAGSHALLRIAREIRHRSLTLTCVYVSNVEFYLFGDERWRNYVDNLRTLPMASNAWIIRSYANRWGEGSSPSGPYMHTIFKSLGRFLENQAAGRKGTYWDLVTSETPDR